MASSRALAAMAKAMGDNDLAESIMEETKPPFRLVEECVDCLKVTIKLTAVDDFNRVNEIVQGFLESLREEGLFFSVDYLYFKRTKDYVKIPSIKELNGSQV